VGLVFRHAAKRAEIKTLVMAGLVPAIHFFEAAQGSFGLWKMDGRHEGGHDGEGSDIISDSYACFSNFPLGISFQ
jgi:hypothetical protein